MPQRLSSVCLVMLALLSPALGEKMKVLVSMTPPQLEHFEKHLVHSFELVYNKKIEVINAGNIDDIERLVDLHKGQIGLYMVPFGKCWSMVYKEKVMKLSRFMSKAELAALRKDYILTWLGEKAGTPYFLPHKYETRIMAYRKSKVDDAIRIWNTSNDTLYPMRDTINTLMKGINGQGLPVDYTLEVDPAGWDFFDLFVVGAIWARTGYDGQLKARIGHRSKHYSGTALRLIDRAFACGGDSAIVLNLLGNPIVDAFHWEAVNAYTGLYNEGMWKQAWSGQELWQAFGSNDIFLAFLTQLDCFFVHGTGDEEMKGFLGDPTDLGLALMPQGCSVELDAKGHPRRVGTKAVTNGGWWWAVPADWDDPELSYKLFRYLTSREHQLDECVRFGMIPIRSDILKDKSILFNGSWVAEVFRTSYQQIQKNNNVIVPVHPHFDAISNLYLAAWEDLVVGRNWAQEKGAVPQRGHIAQQLQQQYASQVPGIVSK